MVRAEVPRLVDRIALRLGHGSGPRSGDYLLHRKRIYILPSRAGLLFAGAMATMLLATINYSLALGYVLTFVLVSVGLVSMLHTYRNLSGLILRPGRGDPVHAGQLAELSMTLVNRSKHMRYALQVESPGGREALIHDVGAQAEKIVTVALPTRQRGWMPAPRFTLSTTFPLGLWRAWTYWQPASRLLVHPWPETPPAPLPESSQADGEMQDRSRGDDDFSAVRPYREGDPLRRLAWKAMARSATDDPLTKSFEGGSGGELLLDWRGLPGTLDVEARLSRLTRWVLQAELAGQRFALALPGSDIEADSGPSHRAACLEALATFSLPRHTVTPGTAATAATANHCSHRDRGTGGAMTRQRKPFRLSIRVLGGRLGATWERERRDTLFLMGAVLLSVLPQAAYLPLWCSAGFMILFTWRLGLIFSGHPLPGAAVRMAAALAIVGAVFAQYHTLLGREAGVALLVLFLGLKLMEMRARRDLFVVIFLCCFLLLTGYFHSQGILMAGATMLAVLTLVASMLTMQFRQEEIPVPQRLRYASVLLLQAIPVAAALFVLFPRPSGPLWGLPEDAYSGRTGLSDSMSPGEIASLAESEEVVMRIGFDRATPPVSRMYWRGPSFGEFDGRVWRPARFSASLPPQPELRLATGNTDVIRYTTTMEPAGSRWILALETATQVPVVAGRRVMISPTFELIANDSLAERIRYEGEARLDAQIGRNESRLSLQNWLKLPPGYNPRTLEMAQRWRAEGEASVPALVDRAMDWLRRDRFTYTLTPPLLGRHSVDEFLFDTKAGFCEHFSSAFVVLMRALGVPARVVTGYQGAERNDADNYWIVRQSNAHAWAEVWSEGAGWIRVDPTSAVAPDRIERGSARAFDQQNRARSGFGSQDWLRGWRLSLDALTHNWNQWVLAYDKSRQQSLLNRFGIDITDWREAAGAIAGVLGLLLGAVALATLRPRTTKDPVERQFDEFCQRLAAIGAERFPHETANNYLYRIERLLDPEQSALAHDIVATYNRLRYDLGSSQRDILDHLKRMVRAFRP